MRRRGAREAPDAKPRRRLAAVLGTAGLLTLSGCGTPEPRSAGATCEDLLDWTITLERSGQSGNGHDELSHAIETLRTSTCSNAWGVWVDYASTKVLAEVEAEHLGHPVSCAGLASAGGGVLRPRAIQLLREDGYCRGGAGRAPTGVREESQPEGGIAWSEAINHVGAHRRVCGPLASVRGSSDDVFLNIGRDYPNPKRFTIVLWDIGSVQPVPSGTTVCTSGRVSVYEGVAQIESWSVDEVELFE